MCLCNILIHMIVAHSCMQLGRASYIAYETLPTYDVKLDLKHGKGLMRSQGICLQALCQPSLATFRAAGCLLHP